MSKALKRLMVLSALSKQEIEATINIMVEGLQELGNVRATSSLDFNIGATEARISFMVTTTARAVSTYFISKGFRHLSAGMMKKTVGDSIATLTLTTSGAQGVAVTLKVYSARS